MLSPSQMLVDLSSNDPVIKQKAIDAVKILNVNDRNILIKTAKISGGLNKLHELLTGVKNVNPDVSAIQLPHRSTKTIIIGEEQDTHIKQHWSDSIIKFNSNYDDLYIKNPNIGIVVGTYAAVPYIHLQLEARKRFYPHVPILVHDDCSSKGKELIKLCEQYNCEFETNSKRQPHHLGDLTVFVGGMKWAEHKHLDILLKVSRRWLFLVDWTHSLKELAIESQYATFSNYTASYAFGFRTECVGMSVKEWARSSFYNKTVGKINEHKHVFVENYIHVLAQEIELNRCNKAKKWREMNPTQPERSGYAAWSLMGTDRIDKNPSGKYLWHDSHSTKQYMEQAAKWGLSYKEDDFKDPNQGDGLGNSIK